MSAFHRHQGGDRLLPAFRPTTTAYPYVQKQYQDADDALSPMPSLKDSYHESSRMMSSSTENSSSIVMEERDQESFDYNRHSAFSDIRVQHKLRVTPEEAMAAQEASPIIRNQNSLEDLFGKFMTNLHALDEASRVMDSEQTSMGPIDPVEQSRRDPVATRTLEPTEGSPFIPIETKDISAAESITLNSSLRSQEQEVVFDVSTSPLPESFPTDLKELSWRNDPDGGFSDWQIKVVRIDSQGSDLYHVHRMVLALGERRSAYFADLFQKQAQDNKNHRLRLEMPDKLANLFPAVLDFMYGEDNVSALKRKQVFTLYDQAEYFQIPSLKAEIATWFRRRLQYFDVPRFLVDIDRFQDIDPLEEVAVEICALQFESLEEDFPSKIDPIILLRVFDVLAECEYCFLDKVDFIMKLVLACCGAHDVEYNTFVKLTSSRFLPRLPLRRTIALMSMTSKYRGDDERLASLEARSVRVLSKHWEFLCSEYSSREEMATDLSLLPPRVLAQILVQHAQTPWNDEN